MSFNDIACHVWAIDGYVDDALAKLVNDRYSMLANSLLATVADTKSWRTQALQSLITHARRSTLTSEKVIVYGGFRAGQAAPEHMWLEYDGKIYETMPGADLETYGVTPALRMQPRLEGSPFPADGVIGVPSKLTTNQQSYLRGLASYGTSRPMSELRG